MFLPRSTFVCLMSFWNSSYVTLIHECNGSIFKKYKHITILSPIPKLFESFVTYVLKTDFIDEKFFFQMNKLTELNLLCYIDFFWKALEKRSLVDSTYSDFYNAFVRVNYNILIPKLGSVDIGGNLLLWVENLLKNWVQKIKIYGFLSKWNCNNLELPKALISDLFYFMYL